MTSEIVYLTHAVLITCVVEAGKSGDVIQAASSAGAKGSFVNYAKGQGIKESMGLIGVTIDNDKEVVRFIVSEEQAGHVTDAIYTRTQLSMPGKGIMFTQNLERVATHIPDQVLVNQEGSHD
ncbi:MAG: transcriptional regulator [Legionellales bacterium]|nr:transcriptional regulator [Legionellales bacterium]|tara:strand:+ start:615 stop:980 length:366 start_codon:yes stop_codon:yes gene_type:complete